MSKSSLIGPWIRRFLMEHLVRERNLARNTQTSYRDMLTLQPSNLRNLLTGCMLKIFQQRLSVIFLSIWSKKEDAVWRLAINDLPASMH